MLPKTIYLRGSVCEIIDQTLLPSRFKIRKVKSAKEMARAILELADRGAPAIGIAGAYGLFIEMKKNSFRTKTKFEVAMQKTADFLIRTRPTAVNLSWAVNRCLKAALKKETPLQMINALRLESRAIHKEDIEMCLAIGVHGQKLLPKRGNVITHCNAGALATGGQGTALSVIYEAKKAKKRITVFANETRPLLQGSRITAWELGRMNVPVKVVTDNMAAAVMKKFKPACVIVGADRIARNGDTANKIGTYGLAILAKAHKIPFYVAAPYSTIDYSLSTGKRIPIEERKAEEVAYFGKIKTTPKKVSVYNPAFDITPWRLISAIITEKGIFRKPFKGKL